MFVFASSSFFLSKSLHCQNRPAPLCLESGGTTGTPNSEYADFTACQEAFVVESEISPKAAFDSTHFHGKLFVAQLTPLESNRRVEEEPSRGCHKQTKPGTFYDFAISCRKYTKSQQLSIFLGIHHHHRIDRDTDVRPMFLSNSSSVDFCSSNECFDFNSFSVQTK